MKILYLVFKVSRSGKLDLFNDGFGCLHGNRVNQERTSNYNLMRIVRKASKEVEVDSEIYLL